MNQTQTEIVVKEERGDGDGKLTSEIPAANHPDGLVAQPSYCRNWIAVGVKARQQKPSAPSISVLRWSTTL
jgi:hypothetical protein